MLFLLGFGHENIFLIHAKLDKILYLIIYGYGPVAVLINYLSIN
jgi:hypothetical protein